jgi:hypothetical protein
LGIAQGSGARHGGMIFNWKSGMVNRVAMKWGESAAAEEMQAIRAAVRV